MLSLIRNILTWMPLVMVLVSMVLAAPMLNIQKPLFDTSQFEHQDMDVADATEGTNDLQNINGRVKSVFDLPGRSHAQTNRETYPDSLDSSAHDATVNAATHRSNNDEPSEPMTLLQLVNTRPDLTILASLVLSRDTITTALSDPNANITLFAPSDEALDDVHHLPPDDNVVTNILLYHVVSPVLPMAELRDGLVVDTAYVSDGLDADINTQKIRVTGSGDAGIVRLNWHVSIDVSDIVASNGVMHLVNRVLVPPPNMVWVMSHVPIEFGVTLLAIGRSGLTKQIKTTPNITLFAPTNQAFRKLGVRRVAYLFSTFGKRKLYETVLYLVSPAVYYVDRLPKDTVVDVPTSYGKDLKVEVKTSDPEHGRRGDVEVNGDAHVSVADIIAENGVVHAIDTVLVPFKWEDLDKDVEEWVNKKEQLSDECMDVLESVFGKL